MKSGKQDEDTWKPHVIIITEITQSAVWLEIDSVDTTARATATLTMMLVMALAILCKVARAIMLLTAKI